MVDWLNPSADASAGRTAGWHDRQREVEDLQGEVDAITEERDALRAENEKLKAEVAVLSLLKDDNEHYAVGVEGFKVERLRASELIQRQTDEITQLRAEVEDYRSAAKTAASEECTAGERHRTCVPLLRQEVERLNGRLEETRMAWEARVDQGVEIAELVDKLKHATQRIHHYMQDQLQIEAELAQVWATNRGMGEQNQQLRAQLEQREAIIAKVKKMANPRAIQHAAQGYIGCDCFECHLVRICTPPLPPAPGREEGK